MGTDGEQRLDALEARVRRLEALLAQAAGDPPSRHVASASDADAERFWALRGLRDRLPAEDGAVLFTGVVPLPTDEAGAPIEWQYGLPASALLAGDWTELAEALQALAHPVRLSLLHAVLHGAETVAELTDDAVAGTSGQVYHHLRQLTAAGWLQSTGRGRYAVPATRVVPLLVVLAAARR
ncbi:ArsR/SmtB family transcription factor [Egicoccus halophilus]|uniref:HTH arsR-type domain-containing protein n=1 Tax=Egicoccus halophilus TaxID=1670830 RepID=A0A8J3EX48_9ACTN|nr:helix-turn-helix domain-containing protein [Egicoccus halophilus]GGI05052.1 hypothetical protein GCM10011354_12170 [Egicoccus halophilus]